METPQEGADRRMETKEQTLAKIYFYLKLLSPEDLRLVAAFMRGRVKKSQGI